MSEQELKDVYVRCLSKAKDKIISLNLKESEMLIKKINITIDYYINNVLIVDLIFIIYVIKDMISLNIGDNVILKKMSRELDKKNFLQINREVDNYYGM